MKSLRNAFQSIHYHEPWSVKALANDYNISGTISVADLIDRVFRPSSFHKIKRFFVLVLENRSFDHMLGFSNLTGTDAATGSSTHINGLTVTSQDANGAVAAQVQSDSSGRLIPAVAPAPFAFPFDPGHELPDIMEQIDNGFVANFQKNFPSVDPAPIMACMNPSQVPVLLTLARSYALCDMWFSSGPLSTWPNRFFIHAATSGGLDHSPTGLAKFGSLSDGYAFENGTIFDRLNMTGIPWHIFTNADCPVSHSLAGLHMGSISGMDAFLEQIAEDDFPYKYVFFEPEYDPMSDYTGGNSQHPSNDIRRGEQLIADLFLAISRRNIGMRVSSSSSMTSMGDSSTTSRLHRPFLLATGLVERTVMTLLDRI